MIIKNVTKTTKNHQEHEVNTKEHKEYIVSRKIRHETRVTKHLSWDGSEEGGEAVIFLKKSKRLSRKVEGY